MLQTVPDDHLDRMLGTEIRIAQHAGEEGAALRTVHLQCKRQHEHCPALDAFALHPALDRRAHGLGRAVKGSRCIGLPEAAHDLVHKQLIRQVIKPFGADLAACRRPPVFHRAVRTLTQSCTAVRLL